MQNIKNKEKTSYTHTHTHIHKTTMRHLCRIYTNIWMCWKLTRVLSCKYWALFQLYTVSELVMLQCSCARLRFRCLSAGVGQQCLMSAGVVSFGGQSSLLQSVHRIWSRSGKKPEPTSDTEQREHLKHGWCHCRSSKETYFPSPNPERHKHNTWATNGGMFY